VIQISKVADAEPFALEKAKPLLFQFFGNKLGLYAAVVKRTTRDLTAFLTQTLIPLLEDETVATDAQKFRTFLETAFGALFAYLVAHPHIVRLFLWELAEGWQTTTQIFSHGDLEGLDRYLRLFARARRAGLLRSDVNPLIQLLVAEQMCWSYLGSLPLYQMLLAREDLSSVAELARARTYIVDFLVHGLMVDPTDDEAGARRR
jgi:AcrR family transcriptional regulator